jgi:tryptophan synthase alpha chain
MQNAVSRRRIADRFNADPARKLLVPYITAGDPDLDTTLALMHTLVESGADIIELGIPFSDPMADGPVIQAACERALAVGTRLVDVLDVVARFRQTNDDTAVVLMGYMNPLERLGYAEFAGRASAAGVDGVLTVDLPPEESAELGVELDKAGLDAIYLLSPTTPDARLAAVAERASGYVYYVSLKGVTGAAKLNTDEVASRVKHIKTQVDLPVAVGFGIRDAESAATVSATADAVIVGSVLVAMVGEHGSDPAALHAAVGGTVRSMRDAMDAAADA